jgi:MurNAc alpha-1-phosphate uridylyltransferase
MVQIKQAMILAAGKGTRLGHLTQSTPKPLIEVCGTPVLIHLLNHLKSYGVEKIAINTHYLAAQVEQAVKVWSKDAGIDVRIYHEEELLNTGGGICQAIPFFEGKPFFLVNGDAVWTGGTELFKELENTFRREHMEALLGFIDLDKTSAFRAPKADYEMDAAGQILGRGTRGASWVYMCAAILTPELFAGRDVKPFSLIELYDKAMHKGELYGMSFSGLWADMGTPEGLAFAENLLSLPQHKQTA